ncbi:metallophosphoesterase family protein [Thalassorhabdus alkalitolerans]|uniref:Phosphoesterase n=1 Tax=Thalassorhabdus alkalitolerans TaxID=2282697 RepID=A0ABW0YKN0_9BACI
MKLLVMSDSHGVKKEVTEVKMRHQEVEHVIHCGDSELSTDAPELKGVLAVKGNCDIGDFPEERVEQLGDLTVLVAHGHLYNIKMSLASLTYRAEEAGANVAFFGHSHQAGVLEENGVVYVNPGSLLLPRGYPVPSYAIVEAENNKVLSVSFYEQGSGKEITELSRKF